MEAEGRAPCGVRPLGVRALISFPRRRFRHAVSTSRGTPRCVPAPMRRAPGADGVRDVRSRIPRQQAQWPQAQAARGADDDAGLGAELAEVVAGARRRVVRGGDRHIDTAHLLHSLLESDPEVRAAFGEGQRWRGCSGIWCSGASGTGCGGRGASRTPAGCRSWRGRRGSRRWRRCVWRGRGSGLLGGVAVASASGGPICSPRWCPIRGRGPLRWCGGSGWSRGVGGAAGGSAAG